MSSRRAISIFVFSVVMWSLMWRQTQASPAPAPGKHFLIETEDEDSNGTLTEFVGWMELDRNNRVKFLEIKTDDGEDLTLTKTHNVFYYEDGKPTPTFARNLSPGNVLFGGSGEVFYEYCLLIIVIFIYCYILLL